MNKFELIGAPDVPSVFYLSNVDNLNTEESLFLEEVESTNYLELVERLLEGFSDSESVGKRHCFIAAVIDQVCLAEKTLTPKIVEDILTLGPESKTSESGKTLKMLLWQIKLGLMGQVVPKMLPFNYKTVFKLFEKHEDEIEKGMSDAEKKWFFLRNAMQILCKEGRYTEAIQVFLRAQKDFPDKIEVLNPMAIQSLQFIEGLKLGMLLKRSARSTEGETDDVQVSLSSELAQEHDHFVFAGDAEDPSVRYLSDFEKFSVNQRGILFEFLYRSYTMACYSIDQMLQKQDSSKIDWHFLACLLVQLAKVNDESPSEFFVLMLEGKWKADECQNDIRYYFEELHRSLLDKQLPDISEKVNTKAVSLANKVQAKENVTWSKQEWQATYHRAQAYVYMKSKYYVAAYRSAETARAMSDRESETVDKWMNGFEKFVHAGTLGKVLSGRQQKMSRSAAVAKRAFQLMSSPPYPLLPVKDALDQLGLRVETVENRKGRRRLKGRLGFISPTAITITEANSIFVDAVLEKLSTALVERIELRNCKFSEGFPKGIFAHTHLRYLGISNCFLPNLPQELGQLSNLSTLILSDLPFVNDLPSSLCDLIRLTHLQLNLENLIVLPDDMGNLKKLIDLKIINSSVRVLPESIGELTNLKNFDVSNNKLEVLPEHLHQIFKLEKLSLQGNPWKVLSPKLLHLPSLRYLDLRPKEISNMEVGEDLKAAFLAKHKSSQERRKKQATFYRNIGK